ncbi:hypothetical protein MY04_05965 (plasmid) [Flammeovirga sp. MY04]|uniref:hypothetical protein n=1 Tax=Flammeovirga sp. MY04 TaxID=1191459 RepID=UPI000806237B|nr:hypothetical protein [Flammeovirga sp. MY04]ANQ52926.1 hypothetical protein MY04_05965 [Flammeovirga sp. MY04]
MKQCSKCNEVKSMEDFFNRKATKDGKQSFCKSCHKEAKPYNEERKKYYVEYNKKGKEHIAEVQKKYRAKNVEKIKSDHKAWYEANKEHKAEYYKEWHAKNPTKQKEYNDRKRDKKLSEKDLH